MNDAWASAFNKWMDDYTSNPEAFKATEYLAIEHLREKLAGREPTYGERSAAVFREYLASA